MMSRHFRGSLEPSGAIGVTILIFSWLVGVARFVNIYQTNSARYTATPKVTPMSGAIANGPSMPPGVTLINYKGDNISKYVCPT